MAKRGTPITSERLLVDPKTKGVRNVLVYLVRPAAVREDARKAAPKILQFRADRGVFVPHVLAAMQGASILVTTDDPTFYNFDVRTPGTEALVTTDDSRLEKPKVQSHLQTDELHLRELSGWGTLIVAGPARGRRRRHQCR